MILEKVIIKKWPQGANDAATEGDDDDEWRQAPFITLRHARVEDAQPGFCQVCFWLFYGLSIFYLMSFCKGKHPKN